MANSNAPPRAVQSNIEAIVRLEEAEEQNRSLLERSPEVIGSFAGTVWFVGLQLSLVALWAAANLGVIPGIPVFDPFSCSLLSGVLSLEGVLLTAFVLIRQNRMNAKADRRNHLALQISLLSEKEVTKVIQMLEGMSRSMGIAAETVDEEAKELGETTAVEGLARQLHEHLEVSST